VVLQLGFSNSLLDQLIKGVKIGNPLSLAPPFVLVVLEGYNLSLELLVEQSQLLLLLEDDLVVEGHLLPLAIRLHLLFLHLLPYHVGHLKELVFALLCWLDTGSRFLRRGGASFLGGLWLITIWWGAMPLAVSIAFPLGVTPLTTSFLRAIIDIEEGF